MVVECSFGESLIWVIVFSTKTSTAFTDWVYTQVLTLTRDMQGLVQFAQTELNINLSQILEIYGLQNFEESAFYRECAKEIVSLGYFVYNDDWFEIYSKELMIEYVNNQ